MKVIRTLYEDGQFKPMEPLPEIGSAEVLIIFPDAPCIGRSPELQEEELFGCGADWWTDEVDAAVKDAFRPRPRPW
jgi:hypothetical protein